MPAAVASRARDSAKAAKSTRDALPPAKKAKLSQSTSTPRKNGLHSLISASSDKKPTVAAKINGVRNSRKDRVQDATATVTGGHAGHGDVDMADAGDQIIEISSAEEESDYSSLDEQDADAGAQQDTVAPVSNGNEASPEPEELSFGDRLRAQAPEDHDRVPHVVDVDATFAGPNAGSSALATATSNQPLTAPSATSVGTILTQALRTNDQEMLDSCLRLNDVDMVYATIERLPSPLVGTLIQKLAERLHKRPGRPGMLMVWVQWSISAHGGYLATQPQLVKQLSTLNKVLKERASGLQPLLALKGRLDMLETQLDLRKRNQKRAANDDMDEAVIYVEGEDDLSSEEDDSEDEDADGKVNGSNKKLRQGSLDDDDSSADDMPTTMEVHVDSEGSEDSEDMIDDEAEETDDDSGDDISEEMDDDMEDDEGVSESEDESRPARRSTAGRAGLPRRS